MAVKGKRQVSNRLSIGIAVYVLLAYWTFFAIIHLTIDIFIDLYTDKDYISVFWCTAVIALPLTACTIYLVRQSLFTSWHTYIFFPLIIYGLYTGSAYFTALKLDLLISASVKPETEQVLPVKDVQRVFAGKAGFTHTDVTLRYQQHLITFKGTRTGYFLLKPYTTLQLKMGRSYLGSYYITRVYVPAHERWAARGAYFKDWFARYYWLLVALPLLFVFGLLKDRYFPAHSVNAKPAEKPYYKFFKRLSFILITLFGLFMLILLIVGLLS